MTLGRTVAELQEEVSERELDLWVRYRKKYGPLDPVRRFDTGAAIIASTLVRVHGGKSVPADFLAYGKSQRQESDTEVDFDGFTAALMAAAPGRVKYGRR